MAHLPVPFLAGCTPTDQAQKMAFHTCARRYLRSVAGALAAAGYTHARLVTNGSGVLVGGATRRCSRRPDDLVRLVVVIEAGSTLGTIPGSGRLDGAVVMGWWESDVCQPGRPHGPTTRRGPNRFFPELLDRVALARRLLHDVMDEPATCVTLITEGGNHLRRVRPTPALVEPPIVLSEPGSLVEFARLTMRLADDMASEYPGWRYGCWADLPPAIRLRYTCIAPEDS